MKGSSTDPTKAVMFAYFGGQATPLERRQVEHWLTIPEGAELYFTYLDEWEREYPQFYPDMNTAHRRFMLLTSQPEIPEPIPEVPTQIGFRRLRRLYAGWLIGVAAVVLVAGLWAFKDQWYFITRHSGYGQIQSMMLPDGSTLVLGVNSSIRYTRFGFENGHRRVWLNGEAQFNVTHRSDSQRFTVETPDQTTVEVLGTVFTVNSRRNATLVVLESGRIRLSTPVSRQPLILTPGDVVKVNMGQHPFKQHVPVVSARVTWYNHSFVFDDTPLIDVANQLHDIFGVSVQIPQADLLSRTVSGTFQAETADDLLEALSLMMNLHINRHQSLYVLMK